MSSLLVQTCINIAELMPTELPYPVRASLSASLCALTEHLKAQPTSDEFDEVCTIIHQVRAGNMRRVNVQTGPGDSVTLCTNGNALRMDPHAIRCPFCASPVYQNPDSDMEGHSFMCSGEIPIVVDGITVSCPSTTFSYASAEIAIAAWNHRADLS